MMNNEVSLPVGDPGQAKLLQSIPDFWNECSFEPWQWRQFEGVHRRITFRKGSLLGEVASYFVDDYIVWQYDGHTQLSAVEALLAHWRPVEDVMSHRFLVLGDHSGSRPVRRHFWLGIRGWMEILPYCFGGTAHDKFKDLAYLADYGKQVALKEVKG